METLVDIEIPQTKAPVQVPQTKEAPVARDRPKRKGEEELDALLGEETSPRATPVAAPTKHVALEQPAAAAPQAQPRTAPVVVIADKGGDLSIEQKLKASNPALLEKYIQARKQLFSAE